MNSPDFVVQTQSGVRIIYAETEEAEAFLDQWGGTQTLSGGTEADADLMEAIEEEGFSVQDDE